MFNPTEEDEPIEEGKVKDALDAIKKEFSEIVGNEDAILSITQEDEAKIRNELMWKLESEKLFPKSNLS